MDEKMDCQLRHDVQTGSDYGLLYALTVGTWAQ
jgi:hypothetical protein